jgi:hypothetical protein
MVPRLGVGLWVIRAVAVPAPAAIVPRLIASAVVTRRVVRAAAEAGRGGVESSNGF